MPNGFPVIADKALALWSLQNICHLDGGEYRQNLIEHMENEQVLISWGHLRILKAYPANHRTEELKKSWGNGASLTVFMASECYILEAQEKVNLVLIHNISCRKTHIGLKLSSLSRTLIYGPSENLQTCSMLVQWYHQLVLPSQLFKLIFVAPSQSLCCHTLCPKVPKLSPMAYTKWP